MADDTSRLLALVDKHQAKLLTTWMQNQIASGSLRSGQIKEDELRDQSQKFLRALVDGLKSGEADDLTETGWSPVRELLVEFSRSRAMQGFTPTETATFVFS